MNRAVARHVSRDNNTREELRFWQPELADRLDEYDRTMRLAVFACFLGVASAVCGVVSLAICLWHGK
jgi:hypothetical protein